MEFLVYQFVPVVSCTFSGYHWEESDSVFFTPSCQVFTHIAKMPLNLVFYTLNGSNSQPLLLRQMLQAIYCKDITALFSSVSQDPQLLFCRTSFQMHGSQL